ncbi:Glu/Leu/Phe/Val dehydrogenase [Thermodesulfobacteriota bacterium]
MDLRETELAEVKPQAIYEFFDSRYGIVGYLIIDSTINGNSGGGLRIVPGVSKNELAHLARTMTMKYSFLKIPLGGAKAAIITGKKALTEKEKAERIKIVSKKLVRFKDNYYPGTDIGVSEQDFRLILKTTGLREEANIPDTAFYTACTVLICAEELLKKRHEKLRDCRITIEGFGKVGAWVAQKFSESGCKIIAVSNSKGAIFNPKGLNINRLRTLRDSIGDDCISQYKNCQRFKKEDLLQLPTDLLIPCALSWSINRSNADQIQAKIVLSGANNPVTDLAKNILINRGIINFPDFVSNCGGVYGAMLDGFFKNKVLTLRYFEKTFRPGIRDLIHLAEAKKQSIEITAKDIACANFREKKGREKTLLDLGFSYGLKIFRKGWIPSALLRTVGPICLPWMMR